MLFHRISGNSLLHRMDERLLFGTYLLFQIHLVIAERMLFVAGLLLLLTTTAILRLRLRPFLISIRPLLLLLLFLGAIPPLTAAVQGAEVLSPLFRSLDLLLRLLSLLMSTHLILGVLSPSGVARVIRWASRPFGGPGRTFAIVVVALFALLPRVQEIVADQREARTARAPGLGGLRRKIRLTMYPLLRESLLEADRVTEAFLIRGFMTDRGREILAFRTAPWQWAVPGATLLLLLATLLIGGGPN